MSEYTIYRRNTGSMTDLTAQLNIPETIKQAIRNKTVSDETIKEILSIKNPFTLYKIAEIIKRKERYEKNIIKTARFAEKRHNLMKEKISKFKDAKDNRIILSTIWDIGKRDNYAGDPNFYGNAPTQVIEQCIKRLTKQGDIVLDAMAGSGTTIDVCKILSRKVIAYDLNPTRPEILKNDSRKIPLKDDSVDLGFLHPPYLDMVKYSNSDDDLSNMSLDKFLISIKKVITEYYRVLKRNGHMCILIGDVIRDGKFLPISRRMANITEDIGFIDRGYALKLTRGSISQQMRGNILYAELLASQNLKINHDSILFFKKV